MLIIKSSRFDLFYHTRLIIIQLLLTCCLQSIGAYSKPNAIESKSSLLDRPVKIMIDPGHGGIESGATNQGYFEKNINLMLSKQLMKKLNGIQGIQAFLTRKSDHFVDLVKRRQIARSVRSNLFISIHVNACNDPEVRGIIVFSISPKGEDKIERLWNNLENKKTRPLQTADSDVFLSDYQDQTSKFLMSISVNRTSMLSNLFGLAVLDAFKAGDCNVYNARVVKSNFIVLRSPDIPSILVESGFMSNLRDLKELQSPRYQKKWVRALTQGIIRYLNQHPPENSYAAHHELVENNKYYVVLPGDNLHKIAKKTNVVMNRIVELNQLKMDHILSIGKKLRLY